MRACVHACVRACMPVCVCVLGREGSWVFTSTALAVVWTAMSLTGYSDCLTNFHETFLPPCRCHTSFGKCLAQTLEPPVKGHPDEASLLLRPLFFLNLPFILPCK